jgi:hypothetical protein
MTLANEVDRAVHTVIRVIADSTIPTVALSISWALVEYGTGSHGGIGGLLNVAPILSDHHRCDSFVDSPAALENNSR